jgi:tetratricopeptide (TPR) repeat protein
MSVLHQPSRTSVKRSWVIGLGAVVISVCASLQASGQPVSFPECAREPTPSDIDGAKGAHAAAKQYFEKADYEKAIQYWRDAYNFDCTKPALLQNIANAYEKKGDTRAAVDVLRIYLLRSPGAPDHATVREKIENLEKSMSQQPDSGPPPVADAAPPAVVDASVDAGTVEPPPGDAGTTMNLLPWGVAAGGAAIAIAGAILLPVGLSGIADAEDRCGGTRECADDDARKDGNLARTEATIGTIALGVGVLALAGGLVWQFVFTPQQPKAPASALTVTPTVGPRAGGLTFSGAF